MIEYQNSICKKDPPQTWFQELNPGTGSDVNSKNLETLKKSKKKSTIKTKKNKSTFGLSSSSQTKTTKESFAV